MSKYFKIWSILYVSLTLAVAGCAIEPTITKSLERARSAYAKIQADPEITANAEVASYEAKKALQQAEQAEDVPTQEHLAYIAERKAQIAVAVAEKRVAEKEIQRLAAEKDQVILKSRELEVEKARKELKAKEKKLEQAAKEAGLAEAKAREMEAEIAELKGKQTERGIVLTLGDVLFATGRANLMPGGLRTVDKLADFLQKHPDRNVLIEGHTDSVGTAEYNMLLSERRADSVRKALMDRGINAERIMTKGYGESYPVASNKTSAGRQRNRRVEIVVLNPGVSPETMIR
jgi:OOP family OmpA-OmpF porin